MNMRDVAKKVGVSSATVSRVINGSPLVTERTAQRVREVLEKVSYIPNPHATTLKYGRSKTYGLIVPDICNPFYAEFLAAFEHVVREIDYEVLFTNVEEGAKLLSSVRRMLMRHVDGAVLMASEFDTKSIEPLLLHKVPLVTVDRKAVQVGCSDVAVDFESGFDQAVKHLKDLGHRRLGFVGGSEGRKTSRVRFEAFRSALENNGLNFFEEFVHPGNYRVDGGDFAIRALWQKRTRPSAVLTANDLTAFGVIRGLHHMGCVVPRDVSVVGVDDLLLSNVMQPELTTIRVPRQRMAAVCLEALNYTKEDVHRRGARFSVATQLIVRESTLQVATPKKRAAD